MVLKVSMVFLAVFGCEPADKLNSVIEKELAKGVRYDSLFLGVRMGMELQEFYDHCWKINKQGIVKEGPENMSVEYLFKDSLDNPIAFNFYPDINSGNIIHRYKTNFYYYGWAPWNRHLQSDKLFEILPAILMEWYGGNEIFTQIKDGKMHYYKIDGNRMIDMFIASERIVVATYTDLAHPENRKGNNE